MFTAADIYGTTPVYPGTGAAAQTALSATTDMPAGWKGLLNPANPLMWFGVLLLVTVGAAGAAGSVRLGPARLSAGVGKS